MPREYTTGEADAHERGYRQGIESARRTLQILHDRAPDLATCRALLAAITAIDAVPHPARPGERPTIQPPERTP
jgi:hypothetical protein